MTVQFILQSSFIGNAKDAVRFLLDQKATAGLFGHSNHATVMFSRRSVKKAGNVSAGSVESGVQWLRRKMREDPLIERISVHVVVFNIAT